MAHRDLYAVLIPRKLYERIEEIAEQRGSSVDGIYRRVIEHGLENYLMDDERRKLVGNNGDVRRVVLKREDFPSLIL